MYTIEIIDDLFSAVKYSSELAKFCKIAEEEQLPASENMHFSDWETNKASLLYLLYKEERFFKPNGALFLAFSENELIALSGVYKSDFCSDIFIGGVRAWTLKKFRSLYVHGNSVFPAQFEWAQEHGAKMLLLSFNDYNDWLFKFILRGIQGKATAFGRAFSDQYKDFELHPTKVMIKGVYQYILKKKLISNFDFDFNKIGEKNGVVAELK